MTLRVHAAQHLDGTRRIDADRRGLGDADAEATGGGLDVHRDPDAEEAALLARRRLVATEGVVVEDRHGLFERFGRRDVVERRTRARGVRKVGMLDDVASAQVERVDPHPSRRDVDHDLARGGRLHHPGPAVCAASRGVRDHARTRATDLPDLVGAGEESQDGRAAAPGRIRPEVVDVLDLHGNDRAVGVERDRHLRLLGARVRRGDEVLPAVLDPLHGATERA
jgi:hypothetical protein